MPGTLISWIVSPSKYIFCGLFLSSREGNQSEDSAKTEGTLLTEADVLGTSSEQGGSECGHWAALHQNKLKSGLPVFFGLWLKVLAKFGTNP